MLPLECFEMIRLCLDYLLDIVMTWIIVDIGVSVTIVIFLGINSVIKLVKCCQIELFQCSHICLCGKALMRAIVVTSRRCLPLGKVMGMLTLIR